jgi:hypothetical protein
MQTVSIVLFALPGILLAILTLRLPPKRFTRVIKPHDPSRDNLRHACGNPHWDSAL